MASKTNSRKTKVRRAKPKSPAALQRVLYHNAIAMLGMLEKTMVSPFPGPNEELQRAMLTYVNFFTIGSVKCTSAERHAAAMALALAPLTGDLRDYANKALSNAWEATQRSHKKAAPAV